MASADVSKQVEEGAVFVDSTPPVVERTVQSERILRAPAAPAPDQLCLALTALMYHLKQQAIRDCDAAARAYAECASGRVFSVVWACRQEFSDLNSCLKTR